MEKNWGDTPSATLNDLYQMDHLTQDFLLFDESACIFYTATISLMFVFWQLNQQ